MLSTSYDVKTRRREFDPRRRGHDLEKLVCGISSAKVFMSQGCVLPERLNFQQSIADCLNHQPEQVMATDKRGRPSGLQPWDPFRPPTFQGRRILYWVRRRLPKNYGWRVGLHLALGRSLDQWHGVDLVLVCWPATPNQSRRRVTIDLTTFEKIDCRANLQLSPAKLNREMAAIGQDIALFFREEIDRVELSRRLQSWAVTRGKS